MDVCYYFFRSIHSRQCIWKKSLYTDSINKIPLKKIPVKNNTKNGTLENIFCPSWKVGIGFGSGILINVLGQRWIVHCQQKSNVLSLKRDYKDDKQKFDWDKFWSYLWPHRLYFLAAIAVRIHFLNSTNNYFEYKKFTSFLPGGSGCGCCEYLHSSVDWMCGEYIGCT